MTTDEMLLMHDEFQVSAGMEAARAVTHDTPSYGDLPVFEEGEVTNVFHMLDGEP